MFQFKAGFFVWGGEGKIYVHTRKGTASAAVSHSGILLQTEIATTSQTPREGSIENWHTTEEEGAGELFK